MDEETEHERGLPAFAAVPVLSLAAAFATVLTALSGRYGYHRDELYFLAAGDHPALGYVDQPPFTPLVARAATALFGDSPAGLRVPATLAFVLSVVVAALLARELGGPRRVQVVAAGLVGLGGQALGTGHMASTATFDLPMWLVICWLVLRLLRTGDGRWWLAIGAAVGAGMLNKYLVLLLAVVLFAAVAAVGPRRVLRTPWLPAGVGVALAVALPNLWWQASHDWPQLTVARGISGDDGTENRIMFLPGQLLYISPLLVPVWIAGWLRLWRDPALRWARSTAVAYPLLCLLVLALGGKGYYALPLLNVLLVAGCAPLLDWIGRHGRTGVVTAGAAVTTTAAMSAMVTLPVLPPGALAVPMALNKEQGEQIGWPELTDAVREGWLRIPSDRRARSVILTQNYGQAGALDRFGPERGLPRPYSGHMSYADWGPPPDSADAAVLLVRQEGEEGIERYFTGCRTVARVDNGQGVDNEEQGSVVALCSGPTRPWSTLWPSLRHFY
ncbi:ArnT family glycosyltransferase [Streptomyces cavernae]|uniref:ArnT family glycosyltransferase n=1 Tax=Streptomyces cavernae TaxID=2259034 RepID=UPI000FEB90E5|nr:glycosyltransferase family 39 protein [Streptomyces cavernae]